MGNAAVKQVAPASYFLIERILDSHCGYLEQYGYKPHFKEWNIVLGIHRNSDDTNPLGGQGIRIGGSPIYSLKKVEFDTDNKQFIRYFFDNDVLLEVWWSGIYKKHYYKLKTKEFEITKDVPPLLANHFKKLEMSSPELDTLHSLFTRPEEQLR